MLQRCGAATVVGKLHNRLALASDCRSFGINEEA